jgi:hypothetical protein
MKTRLLLVFSFLLGAGCMVNAQVLSYGARLGMAFPGFRDEKIASQRITPTLGISGSLRLADAFQIVAEVGYQRNGNKYTNHYWDSQSQVVDDSTYLVKTNLDYIRIPLYMRLNLGGSNKFYLQAGGYYGYLLHANFTGKRFGQMVSKVPIREGLAVHDYGVIVGGGIETPIRTGLTIALDLKYQIGLNDLNKNPLILGYSLPVKNKGLSMSMGFMVDIE